MHTGASPKMTIYFDEIGKILDNCDTVDTT